MIKFGLVKWNIIINDDENIRSFRKFKKIDNSLLISGSTNHFIDSYLSINFRLFKTESLKNIAIALAERFELKFSGAEIRVNKK